jgi:hypothetical protein|nr:MAG TPA: hypothetical protein [Bacteriophage sp.]
MDFTIGSLVALNKTPCLGEVTKLRLLIVNSSVTSVFVPAIYSLYFPEILDCIKSPAATIGTPVIFDNLFYKSISIKLYLENSSTNTKEASIDLFTSHVDENI